MAVLDAATGAKVKEYAFTGPASYATGGFLLDASADFSWIGLVEVMVTTRGVLPPVHFDVLNNRDLSSAEAFGKATIQIMRARYDRATMGNPTGLPSGAAVQSAKFAAATTVGSGHTHSIDHDHPAATSATETATGTLGVNLAAAGGNMRNHTHSFNVPALTATNTSSTAHTHDRSFEYDHIHTKTVATVDAAAVEIANATNLSGVSMRALVYGFGKA